jgi:hypothetical protein
MPLTQKNGQTLLKLWKYGTTVGQIAEVVLESGKSGNNLPVQPESGYSIRDPFLGFWCHLKDGLA